MNWGRGSSLEAPSSSCHLRTKTRETGNLHSDLRLISRILGSDPVTVAGVRKPIISESCDAKVCAHVSNSSSDLHSRLPAQAIAPSRSPFGFVRKRDPQAAVNVVPLN